MVMCVLCYKVCKKNYVLNDVSKFTNHIHILLTVCVCAFKKMLYKLTAEAIIGLLMSDSGLWLADVCYRYTQ